MMCSIRRVLTKSIARSGGAGHQNQSTLLLTDLFENLGQHQFLEGLDTRRNQAQDEAYGSPLLKDIAAKPAHSRHRVRDVGLEQVFETLFLP